jgi:DnaK suppressor protein
VCVLADAVVRRRGRCEPFRVGDAWDVNKHEVEARLTAERAAASRRISSMTADLAAVAAAAVGSNLDDEHDPEGSTIAFEREQLAALRAHAQVRLTEVDEALSRLHDNRYGQCELCGKPIANARLAVLPATRRCITCAAQAVQ